MIYDLMPRWLRWLLDMDRTVLPTDDWTWRHNCRFGRDPAKLADDNARYSKRNGWKLRVHQ